MGPQLCVLALVGSLHLKMTVGKWSLEEYFDSEAYILRFGIDVR